MTNTYLITLTPTGKFFFGGDMTFEVRSKDKNKEKEDKEFNSKFSSYIIRSNKFPQQTSLLGMLRFLILRNNKEVFDAGTQSIINRTSAENMIGKKSFENSNKEGDFKKIKKLHHCFLQKDGKPIRYLERDYKYTVEFGDIKGRSLKSSNELTIPTIEGYDPKDGIASLYLIEGVEIPESDIFVEDISNGINRDIETGKTDDNALFKQICYRFNTKLYRYKKPSYDKDRKRTKDGSGNYEFTSCQYSFAFYAEMDLTDEEVKKYNGQLVSVGGDNSQFVIGIEQKKIPPMEETKGTKVVLESPAYLTKEDLENVRFAITDTIPFKCMKTETKDVKSYDKRNQMYGYSESLSLYDKGSVFYFRDENEAKKFTDKLKDHADFYQIGYNHYQVK